MSNKEHAWRLLDEKGNPKQEIPTNQDLERAMNQSLMNALRRELNRNILRRELNRTLGRTMEESLQRHMRTSQQGQLMSRIMMEVQHYEARHGIHPAFLSVRPEVVRELYAINQRNLQLSASMSVSADLSTVCGMTLICNPQQEQDILILGHPYQEAFISDDTIRASTIRSEHLEPFEPLDYAYENVRLLGDDRDEE